MLLTSLQRAHWPTGTHSLPQADIRQFTSTETSSPRHKTAHRCLIFLTQTPTHVVPFVGSSEILLAYITSLSLLNILWLLSPESAMKKALKCKTAMLRKWYVKKDCFKLRIAYTCRTQVLSSTNTDYINNSALT